MASSLINNSIQVYFDSVLGMEHEGMVAMFESLLLSGLSGFLGCSSAIYEDDLVQFFHNASVGDGKVVSTVKWKPVAISKELFAGTFELPLEGLTDLHEREKIFGYPYHGQLLLANWNFYLNDNTMTLWPRSVNPSRLFANDGLTALVVRGTVRELEVDPTDSCGVFRRGLDVKLISSNSSSSSIHPDPTASDSFSQRNPDTFLNSRSQSTSTGFRMLLTTDDIPLGIETDVDQILMPTADVTPQDFTEHLAQLRASVNQIQIERVQKRNDDMTYRGLFANFRQEVQIQKASLSLEILESRRKLQSQQVSLSQDMDDKLKGVQDQQAAVSHDLMEFRVQAQENYNTLTSQLSELVDHINRGGDAKKGEGSSSRGLQPPPDDRSRPGSGDSSRGRGSRSEHARKRGGGSGGSHRRDWRYWIGGSSLLDRSGQFF
ncbi:U-box domain-containing protein 33-like [Dorcoceras hygrometricum]|uniref:U-box domain-containing protein 33-like n=1 Tax=Dorcoceras hygrometricum TaxID=472368 RepID=A0A2Z7CMP3_9LAMI|nr:U-box domain-containing protein 33-like [Dorcoceras hygrometricum]